VANWRPTNNENKGVIPAQAGIQNNTEELDSCFRRNDTNGIIYFLCNTELLLLPILDRGLDLLSQI
jgi:hypothetical protein